MAEDGPRAGSGVRRRAGAVEEARGGAAHGQRWPDGGLVCGVEEALRREGDEAACHGGRRGVGR